MGETEWLGEISIGMDYEGSTIYNYVLKTKQKEVKAPNMQAVSNAILDLIQDLIEDHVKQMALPSFLKGDD